MKTPSGIALYRLSTASSRFYNDSRKFCPGCKRHRSIRQFTNLTNVLCQRCTQRGVNPA